MKGVSIFYEFHDQGCPHIIAGIHSPEELTEDTMRDKLSHVMGYNSLEELNNRSTITFINHTHLYAKSLLGEELDKDTKYVLQKFLPKALDVQFFEASYTVFYFEDTEANEFICNNRYYKELKEHRKELQNVAAQAYREKREKREQEKLAK